MTCVVRNADRRPSASDLNAPRRAIAGSVVWTAPKEFNERSGGLLNRTQYPSDVIALVVLWRLRYKLSLRDLAEMFLIRGFVFTYEAVRDWEAKLTPVLAEQPSTRYRTFVTPSQRKAAIRYSGSDPWGRTGHAGWLLHEDRVMFA